MNSDYYRLIGQLAGLAAGAYVGDANAGMQLGGAAGSAAGSAFGDKPQSKMPQVTTPGQPQRPQASSSSQLPITANAMPIQSIKTPQPPLSMPPNPSAPIAVRPMPMPEVNKSVELLEEQDEDRDRDLRDQKRRQQMSLDFSDPRLEYIARRMT